MIKSYKITANISVFIWILIGVLVIYSTFLDKLIMFVNILMGFVFLFIGLYLYKKTKNTICLIDEILEFKNEHKNSFGSINKFLRTELIFNIVNILFSMILLSGTISRVFYESKAVFG